MRLRMRSGVRGRFVLALAVSNAQQRPAAPDVAIDADDIGGVVTGPAGPEAGVWVIAETRDLPVRYIKSVVTDDRGRFVVPDLPKASYQVWARGYGLVDSAKATAAPGQRLAISAVPAPNEAAAAHYYPAIYWYSMLKIPDAGEFGGKSAIPARLTQPAWISAMKNTGCVGCHQLGQASTRTIPPALGTFASGAEAWKRRVQSGQSGTQMFGQLNGLGEVAFANYGDWTDRVAKGELPFAKPQRPQGAERNIVVTLRDWMNDKQYLHDLIASDRRFPTVNAYGPLIGSPEYSSDTLPMLDPVKNVATTFVAPVRDTSMPLSLGPGHAAALDALQPSPYWGTDRIWDTRVNNHNSMYGRDGKLWLAASIRAAENPAFCKQGSTHPSAVAFPMERAIRHIALLDPKTKKYTFVDTCFSTHHLQFGYDANDTLWTSGGGPVVGWLNTKQFEKTGDAAASQGWTALVLDTNGNGKRDAYTEPDQPLDPGQGPANPGGVLCRDAEPGGRLGVGLGAGRARRGRQAVTRARTRRRRRWPRSTTCRCRASARAAPTSTRTAWCGCRSAAATWAASTGASARRRSTAPRRPAITAPRAGRFTSTRARASAASARTAPSRAITRGWISTTRSASARTSRCPPAT